jgi:hypothetical protein
MKTTFRTSILIGIFYVVCGNSCKKSTPSATLPPITEDGKNTFGCKVNGQVWVPYFRCFDLVAGATELSYNIQPIDSGSSLPLTFWLSAGNSTNGESFFSFRQNYSLSDHIYGPGNIIDSLIINFIPGPGPIYSNFQVYQVSSTPRFLQVSKLDTVNKIISGTFAFTLYTTVANILDSVVVSEGRFDLQIGGYTRCSH